MCGRYTQTSEGSALRMRFNCREDNVEEVTPRYNQAPGQLAAVVLPAADGRRLSLMRWGFPVEWRSQPLINVRSETAVSRPSFREAMVRRRCLVPADGFYEWQRTGDKAGKTPWRFVLRDSDLFAFAGVWTSATGGKGSEAPGFAVLTMAANACVATIHSRMPLILRRDTEALWMDCALDVSEVVEAVMRRNAADALRAYTVSPCVNNVAQDDHELMKPVVPDMEQGFLF